MINLKSLTYDALKDFVHELGWEEYRAQQIFSWIWQKGVSDLNKFTNLSKPKRALLSSKSFISELKLIRKEISKDGTEKFLFQLNDENNIESVFIPEKERRTVCVSTQVGCPLRCEICYTGKMGFIRNLEFYEICDQVLQIQKITKKRITNVVFMGMGEPFLNFDESLKAVEILNSDFGLNIGARKITVSTAGIVEGIKRLADSPLQVKLAISLNSGDNEIRNFLMPINRKYPLEVLLKAIKDYTKKKQKRVTFEYVLIKGINEKKKDAKRLIQLLKNIPCKINLISFNPLPGSHFQPPDYLAIIQFRDWLYPYLPAVTIRNSKGSDILAGCGQLRSAFDR